MKWRAKSHIFVGDSQFIVEFVLTLVMKAPLKN